MKKVTALALVLVLVAGIISGCSSTGSAATATPSAAPSASESPSPSSTEKEVYIAAVAAEVGIPYFTTMQWGAMDAAKDYNVKLYWTGSAEWDFTKQMTYVDGVMATNPDALLLVPTDSSAMISYVKEWMDKGLPVISCDAALEEHVDLVGYNSDPYQGGAAAAEYYFKLNGAGGIYLPVSTNPGSYGANQRIAGFVETMKKLDPTCKMLETLFPGNDANKAAQLVGAAITGNPDMTGIFVATSAPAEGAASAVIEAGKQGKIKLAAFDADPQQIQDLKDGVYDVLVAQNPYQMGYDAVENLAKYVRGELKKEDFTKDVVHYDVCLLTRDNVDDADVQHFKYIAELSEVGY
ncbi:Ribose import binding protein RbsB [bioreactor metagenome]|uniref:Ribose import binding protein RbsB n=1 Tax=bioreactor metagenome TaxID=1076179 RepID=A0A644VY31_9ZZZZ